MKRSSSQLSSSQAANRPRQETPSTMDADEKDKIIIEAIRFMERLLPPHYLPAFYLREIVSQTDALKQEYIEIVKCKDLLGTDSELSKLLDECIASGKFQRVRDYGEVAIVSGRYTIDVTLEKLQSQSRTSIIKMPEVGKVEFAGPMLQASHNAFTQTFVGNGDDTLLSTLDHYLATANARPRAYNLSLSIIQSSGMGKSRVVDRAAEKRLTFPLNLRGEIEGVKAYPPPDNDVCVYFAPTPSDTDEILQRKFLFFLIAMFQMAIPIIKEFKGNYRSVTLQWHDYLADGQSAMSVGQNRKSFYRSVIDAAKLSMSNRGTDKLMDIVKLTSNVIGELRKVLPDDCPALSKRSSDNVFCIVYFDEAHTLVTKVGALDCRRRTAYDNLETVSSMLWEWSALNHVFFLFLSTNSNLRAIAPAAANHPSARAWRGTRLFPQYTELPFDIFPQNIVSRLEKENKLTLNGVCSLDEIIRFGRPLWYSQMTNLNTHWNMIQYAIDKFTSDGTSTFERFQVITKTNIAALDIRISLGFDSLQPVARELESALVENNLRIVYIAPEHHEYMRSGYPSEPLLAEAAARILNDGSTAGSEISEAVIAKKGPLILSEALKLGFLTRGEREEMVARLLVTIAHDRAILKTPKRLLSSPIFHRAVKVLDFLNALFHKNFHKTIAEAKPVSDSRGKTLEEAFKDAYINFSHFSRAGDSEAVEPDNLWLTLVRGNALQCVGHQGSIDMAWAIFFGDPSQTPIHKSRISVGQALANNVVDSEDVLVDPTISSSNADLPSLSLVLQLGSRSKDKNSLVEAYKFDRNFRSSFKGLHARHYEIVAHGCSSEIYSAIPSECDRVYESILTEGHFADDFPRNGMEANRRALYYLKPEFYGNPELKEMSWDWI